MPVLPLPEVVISAVDVIVTNPPLEEANMPFASVVMMLNGRGVDVQRARCRCW